MTNKILQLVTARGGSKGIPDKNLKDLGGKPLLAWSIEQAQRSTLNSRIILSTDSESIAEVGQKLGAEVPFLRPAELASDTAKHFDVLMHAIEFLEKQNWHPDVLVLLQPTSPLRLPEDISASYQELVNHEASAVISVCEAESHPYFTHTIGVNGELKCFSDEWDQYSRRQDLPKAYRENGAVMVYLVEALKTEKTLLPKRTRGYVMPASRSIDIDTNWDLKLAEFILATGLTDE